MQQKKLSGIEYNVPEGFLKIAFTSGIECNVSEGFLEITICLENKTCHLNLVLTFSVFKNFEKFYL